MTTLLTERLFLKHSDATWMEAAVTKKGPILEERAAVEAKPTQRCLCTFLHVLIPHLGEGMATGREKSLRNEVETSNPCTQNH